MGTFLTSFQGDTIKEFQHMHSAILSRLNRNVPIVNLLEMSPFCVVVFWVECALELRPVVRAKRKCVFHPEALRSPGLEPMASCVYNPAATDGLA